MLCGLNHLSKTSKETKFFQKTSVDRKRSCGIAKSRCSGSDLPIRTEQSGRLFPNLFDELDFLSLQKKIPESK